MQDQLRDRMAAYLAAHDTGVLSTAASQGAWAMPVRYRPAPGACGSRGLEVDCLLPCWADAAYFIEQNPCVLLSIHDPPPSHQPGGTTGGWLRWLQIAGTAHAMPDPDWAEWLPAWSSLVPPADLYLPLRVTPRRVELFDEGRGWGARETVELQSKERHV